MLTLLFLATQVAAQSSSSATAPPSVSTAVPAPTASLTSPVGSQAALPPTQKWCPSQIFCAGTILQTLNIAQPFSDSKTIVDKPTNKNSSSVVADFTNLVTQRGGAGNITEGDIVTFLQNDFRGEGLELQAQSLPNFPASPTFLNNVADPLIKAFASTVHGFWKDLIRGTDKANVCGEGTDNGSCESSLIPLNRTFVVPGGRFREQYYWDSYWILEGLIKSQLLDEVNNTLQNFMDELDTIGFIPNGGRIYYLNRSQPPLFIRMLLNYVLASNNTQILTRALPLAEKEMTWWSDNRSIQVKSPFTNATHKVYKYAVVNSAPRPESYLADYLVTNGADLTTPYNESQREALWAELASGAESGWDYCSRFIKEPTLNLTDNTPALRTLNIRATVPVDLNSLLYNAHTSLAELYRLSSAPNKVSRAATHTSIASALRSAILDLSWDPAKLAFYDFNTTSSSRNSAFTVASFYPIWAGITPPQLLANETAAQGFFSSVGLVLARYNGTYPTTFVTSGLQWDAPNAWPPHQYIVLQALRAIPNNVSSGPLPTPQSGQSRFSLVPTGQLGLDEGQLPTQGIEGNTTTFPGTGSAADVNFVNGSFFNGGNVTNNAGWRDVLVKGLANRYVTSALCSWQASGGSIPNLLPQLPPDQRLPGSENLTGLMFEKFSNNDVSSAGRGGEYTVQAGFGWTNGVLLWAAGEFGTELVKPSCPTIVNTASTPSGSTGSGGGGGGGGGNSTGGGGGSGGALGVRPAVGWLTAVVLGISVGAGVLML